MTQLAVGGFRGDLMETRHRVAVAVADSAGRIVAASGDVGLVTFMRSAAKPFQALPLVTDGLADPLRPDDVELALACASHNSEMRQVELVRGWLTRMGFAEDDLACGPHRSIAKDLAHRHLDGTRDPMELAPPSRLASNCSGKHTGMLALAAHHGWDTAAYAETGHPVQERAREVIAEWCDASPKKVAGAVDGCGVVTWALPLSGIATGYARLAERRDGMDRVVDAMTTHPEMVAGGRRLCTELMRTYPGRVLAKIGAGGVYGATLLESGLGIAVKVLDGDARAAGVALVEVLRLVELDDVAETLPAYAEPVIVNTNGIVVGRYRPLGILER